MQPTKSEKINPLSLSMKQLELMYEYGPTRWKMLELLVDNESRQFRSARTGKALKINLTQEPPLAKKEGSGRKTRYLITNEGIHELEGRRAGSLLAASAPFYFKKTPDIIAFGQRLDPEDEEIMVKIFSKYKHLRGISKGPKFIDTEEIK